MKKTDVASPSKPKVDRKLVERNRRIHMKSLCFKLSSLIPPRFSDSKEISSQQDQLDTAASYIVELKERIEKLNKMKEQKASNSSTRSDNINNGRDKLPVIEIREMDSSIEVVLISEPQKSFKLHEVVSVLEEEGAEVVSASFSTIADKIFHTIHAQVRISRVGVETTRVSQRLQELARKP